MTTADLDRAVWRKSSRSSASGSDCVEVAELAGAIGVRDSKNPTGPVLRFTPYAWASFTSGLPRASGFTTR
ncbi:DUF397 domain-containing protein [Plantactinospora sp. S1510]|uniref:DUF397 domain-containing protein n=1 Tax=Plantactinospora alkalitolerans TaxID=2789879 RepID=A0ABS0H3E1_9ACTN|nr:DUF397 domain-containing protein [Plantactinospora alkalitolerans]MBF9132839.1 DUF397 domain-containing protein [Plantactinospora alkalitolerans]